jgi:predicted Zn-dependent protease with MMP-like domain
VLSHLPPARRIAVSTAFCLCVAVLIVTAFRGFAPDYPMRLIQGIAVAVGALGLLAGGIALIVTRMTDYREPVDEEEFERLVVRSEQLARDNLAAEPDETDFLERDPYDPADFEELVREALDDLPDLLIKALDHVAVVISDQGRKHRAYGLYQSRPPDTAPREKPGLIVIFRDTLLRDFGDDPDELRAQVTRTVRHELAHHLGADELGVRELGL